MTSPEVPTIELFTIGFTGKSAEEFFELLRSAGVRRLIDTRLNNVSQLAGFAKKRDLEYFLRAIADVDYIHDVELAPTKEMLEAYRGKEIGWDEYAARFHALLETRRPDLRLSADVCDRSCLLCSEPTAEHCHRRLVTEFLAERWGDVRVTHL